VSPIVWVALGLMLARPLSAADAAPRDWYVVVLHGDAKPEAGFGLELPPEKQGLIGVARRDALRERREQLIREAAEALARQYGGEVRDFAYGGEPRFSCAMVEASARRMADDPRVWRVFRGSLRRQRRPRRGEPQAGEPTREYGGRVREVFFRVSRAGDRRLSRRRPYRPLSAFAARTASTIP
jgi:hypothetical protein